MNNSHLRRETTLATVLDSMPFARETATLTRLPLAYTTLPVWLAPQLLGSADAVAGIGSIYQVEIYVRMPWEDGPEPDEKDV